MKSVFNYQILLSRVAKKQYKLHNAKQEWKMFIAFVFLMKIITWAISMYAGFYFFKSLIFATWGNLTFAVIITVFLLVAIEGSTNVALAKFFKFAFRGTNHFTTAITMFFLVMLLFGISFYSSTNGLAMKQARKVDNTADILQQYKEKKRAINKEYSAQIADIDAQISTIKSNPQGWTRGKRTTLLTWQLNKIDSLLFVKSSIKLARKNELNELKQAQDYELNQNRQTMTTEADKYYKIIASVMLIQFIVSGILMYFWKRIHTEDDKNSLIAEEINEMNEIMTSNAFYALRNRMNAVSNAFSVAMLDDMSIQNAIPVQEIEPENNEKERVKVAGFQSEKNAQKNAFPDAQKNAQKSTFPDAQKSTRKNVQPSMRIEHSEDFACAQKNAQKNTFSDAQKSVQKIVFSDAQKNDLQTKYVRYLDKHKIIVRSIKKIGIGEKESISNDEVRRIKQLAQRAKHKSETLIRDVYRVAVTVGLNKIDDNGNINLNT